MLRVSQSHVGHLGRPVGLKGKPEVHEQVSLDVQGPGFRACRDSNKKPLTRNPKPPKPANTQAAPNLEP